MKYAMIFVWDAVTASSSLNEVIDKIILFDSKEDAEKKLKELWTDYFNEKVNEIKKYYGDNYLMRVDKEYGIIEYWRDCETFKNHNAYAVIIKEINEM